MRWRQRWRRRRRRRRARWRRRYRRRKSIEPVLRDEYCRWAKGILYICTCISKNASSIFFFFFLLLSLKIGVLKTHPHTHTSLPQPETKETRRKTKKLTLSITTSIALCSLYLNTTPLSHSLKLKHAAKNLTLHSFTLIRKTPLFRPFRSFVTTKFTWLKFSSGGRKRERGMLELVRMVSRSCQKSQSSREDGGRAS